VDPGWVKNHDPVPGSMMNNLDHISDSLKNSFLGFVMEKFWSGIRDGKKSDRGSGINIWDSQYCVFYAYSFLNVHLHHFQRHTVSHKEVTKQKSMFFIIFFLLMEGSESESGLVEINYGSACRSSSHKNISGYL
jgi:hypothetical protein